MSAPSTNRAPSRPPITNASDETKGGAIWPITWAAVGAGVVTALGFIAAMFGVFDRPQVPQTGAPPVAASPSTISATAEPKPEWFSETADVPPVSSPESQSSTTPTTTKKQGPIEWDDESSGRRPPQTTHNDRDKLLAGAIPPNQDRTASPVQRTTETPSGKGWENDPLAPTATPLSPEDLYERLAPSVVTVEVKDLYGEHAGFGSGFFVDSALIDPRCDMAAFFESWAQRKTESGTPTVHGYVLTNYHVIRPAVSAQIALLNGDKGYVYNVVAEDEKADLALMSVYVETSRPVNAIPLASDDPRVLATVYAIGNPKGLSGSASEGKVSGFRELPEGGRWLQTTAPISPGSSGGPLLLSDGTLAGVTTLSFKDAQNLNFAVPVSKVRTFLNSDYKLRDISAGASVWWAEDDAFRSMISALKAETGPPKAASEKLENARRSNDDGDSAKSGQDADHYTEAIKLAHEAEQSLPQEFRYLAHYVLGKAYLSRACSSLVNDHAGSLAQLQLQFRTNSDAQNGRRHLSQATSSKPDFPPAFNQLRHYHAITGDWIEALRASDALVKLVPRSAEALQKRAKCYDELGRYHSAKADLEAAIDLAPRRASLHYDLGFELR